MRALWWVVLSVGSTVAQAEEGGGAQAAGGAATDAEAAAPERASPAPSAAPVEAPRGRCPEGTLACFEAGSVAAWPRVRLRPAFEAVQADPELLYVGHNDGFFFDQARLGLDMALGAHVRMRFILESASASPGSEPNDPVLNLGTAPRDVFLTWAPSAWFQLQAGQLFMPSDLENGDVLGDIAFTRRSVMSQGVRNGHGQAVSGLSAPRQVGVVVGTGTGAQVGGIPVEARLGVASGNGLNLQGNDNDLPALFLRLGARFSDLVRIGVGGRYNPRTEGSLPNLFQETDAVAFADLTVQAAGAQLVLSAIGRQTSFDTLLPDAQQDGSSETAYGGAAWLTYRYEAPTLAGLRGLVFTPALRTSLYEPSSAFQTDTLLEHTVALRVDGDRATLPLSFFVDYAILTERGDLGGSAKARDLSNNRLTTILQLDL